MSYDTVAFHHCQRQILVLWLFSLALPRLFALFFCWMAKRISGWGCLTTRSCYFFGSLHGTAFAVDFAILRSHFGTARRSQKMGPWKLSFVLLLSGVEGALTSETSRPTWKDVVLDKTFPHLRRNVSPHVAVVLGDMSLLDTNPMWSRLLISFCQKRSKNTCRHKKSSHQDMVCLFK